MLLTKYLTLILFLDEEPEDVHHQLVITSTIEEARTALSKFKELGLTSLFKAGFSSDMLSLKQNKDSFIISLSDSEQDFVMGSIKEFQIDFDDIKTMGYFVFLTKEDYDILQIYAYTDQDESSKLISAAFLATLKKLLDLFLVEELELIKTRLAYRISVLDKAKFYSGFCFYVPREVKENEVIFKGVT